MSENYSILENEEQFESYKNALDILHNYKLHHNNEPDHYPCGVESEHCDDGYDHYFYYQQEVICEECGHKMLVWPKEFLFMY